MSSSMEIVEADDVPSVVNGASTPASVISGDPRFTICSQPQSRGYRFRYASEKEAHGVLQGLNSARKERTYPAVQIDNFSGSARVLAYLSTDESVPKIHPYQLAGPPGSIIHGCWFKESRVRCTEEKFILQNVSIVHVKKNEIPNAAAIRHLSITRLQEYFADPSRPLENLSKELDHHKFSSVLNGPGGMSPGIPTSLPDVVRLTFMAFLCHDDGRRSILGPLHSNAIYDAKSVKTSQLRICKLSRESGSCRGKDEVFLLCDKVDKGDIEVVFTDNHWEGLGEFTVTDVHHQFAIVLRTPAYVDPSIRRPVTVNIMLRRPSDHLYSQPCKFTYKPCYDPPEPPVPQKKIRTDSRLDQEQSFPSGKRGSHAGRESHGAVTSIGGSDAPPATFQHLAKRFALSLFDYADTSDVRQLILPARHLLTVADDSGHTPLMRAVMGNHVELVRQFIEVASTVSGESIVELQNQRGQTALHLAVHKDSPSLVAVLVVEAEAKLSAEDENGNTPAHLGALEDRALALKELLKHASEGDVLRRNRGGMTPLHVAAANSQLACARLITERFPDVISAVDSKGQTALHVAAERGDIAVASHLIVEAGAPVDQKGLCRMTPLHVAAAKGHKHMVELLIAADANPDIPNHEGQTAFDLVKGDDVMVQILRRRTTRNLEWKGEEMPDALPPGDMARVDAGVWTRLCQILDDAGPKPNWKSLSQKMGLSSLNAELGRQKSPSLALLANWQLVGGTCQELKTHLAKLGRYDAAQLIGDALQ